MLEVIEVTLTAPPGWVKPFARVAIADRLIACAHQVTMETNYRWAGEEFEKFEERAMMHTASSSLPRLLQRIENSHPYEVPCVMWRTITTTQAYRDWVIGSTSQS